MTMGPVQLLEGQMHACQCQCALPPCVQHVNHALAAIVKACRQVAGPCAPWECHLPAPMIMMVLRSVRFLISEACQGSKPCSVVGVSGAAVAWARVLLRDDRAARWQLPCAKHRVGRGTEGLPWAWTGGHCCPRCPCCTASTCGLPGSRADMALGFVC